MSTLHHYNTRSRSKSVGLELTSSDSRISASSIGKKKIANKKNKKKSVSANVSVHVDPQFNVQEEHARDEPTSAKKRPKLADISNIIEEAASTSSIDAKPLLIPKKLELASGEQLMNGAPTGDLYDVQVLDDSELQSCSAEEISECIRVISSAATDVWAQQFDEVTLLRRLLLHRREQLEGPSELGAAAFIVAAVESLRSTTVRNGLLCLKQFIKSADNCSSDMCLVVLTQCLIKRCHTGPRFLTQIAEEVIPLLVAHVAPRLLTTACLDLLANKSMDISKKAYLILCDIVPKVDPHSTAEFEPLVRALVGGIGAKSSDVRAACKRCIISVRNSIEPTDFKDFMSTFFSEDIIASVVRDIAGAEKPVGVAKVGGLASFRRGVAFGGNKPSELGSLTTSEKISVGNFSAKRKELFAAASLKTASEGEH